MKPCRRLGKLLGLRRKPKRPPTPPTPTPPPSMSERLVSAARGWWAAAWSVLLVTLAPLRWQPSSTAPPPPPPLSSRDQRVVEAMEAALRRRQREEQGLPVRRDSVEWWRDKRGEGPLVVYPKERWRDVFRPYHFPSPPPAPASPARRRWLPPAPFLTSPMLSSGLLLKQLVGLHALMWLLQLFVLP